MHTSWPCEVFASRLTNGPKTGCGYGHVTSLNFGKLIIYWMPAVLWRCWLGGRKGIRPVKNWVVGCWCGCLGWDADLHIAQQMPLPLRRAVKWLCVCV